MFSLFLLKSKIKCLKHQNAAPDKQPTPEASAVLEPNKPSAPIVLIPKHLVNLRPKQARKIHGSEDITHRWKELGFVAASGGVRLALIMTREILADKDDTTKVSILSVNRTAEEIQCIQELKGLETLYPARVRVSFCLTSAEEGWAGFTGRGDAAMCRAALPSPLDVDGGNDAGVMVIVSGKIQGDKNCEAFVELWGGVMWRKEGSRMQRVRGPVGGILEEIGFAADQVFQVQNRKRAVVQADTGFANAKTQHTAASPLEQNEEAKVPHHLANIRPKQARLIHGHEHVVGRWKELGFVAASGGVRLALILTREILADKDDTTKVSILSVNRTAEEIQCIQELKGLETLYPARVRVSFCLTSAEEGWAGFTGRGDAAMCRAALPSPLDVDGGNDAGVMVIVSGKIQGDKNCEAFVELWGGVMGRKLRQRGGSKMQRVQGPVGGILEEIGFASTQVFQI